jgi:hypothetical protein
MKHPLARSRNGRLQNLVEIEFQLGMVGNEVTHPTSNGFTPVELKA